MTRTVTVIEPAPDADGEVTLLFSLGAARSVADPGAVFADARRWSRHVGIVANDAAAVDRFVRQHGVDNDVDLRAWDKWGTMEDVRAATETPRHVFVGTTRQDRRLAETTGWEFLRVREAAEEAGWELGDPGGDAESGDDLDGLLDRLRRVARGLLRWPF